MLRKKLLLVEDNEVLSKTLKRYLVGLGLKVTTTRTVTGARDLLTNCNFDALILDIHLPDNCGLDLVGPPSKSAIPVIAMTAEDPIFHRQLAYDAGVAAFLEKPFSLIALKRILKCILAGHRCLPDCTREPHKKISPACTQY